VIIELKSSLYDSMVADTIKYKKNDPLYGSKTLDLNVGDYMKKILIGLLVLTSLSTFAEVLGTPEQDPAIEHIQEGFLSAPGFKEDALQLGKEWINCRAFSALKDDYQVFNLENIFNFQKFNGLILNSERVFTSKNGELLSVDSHLLYTVKVTAEGNLLVELAIKKAKDAPRAKTKPVGKYAESINAKAIAYMVCTDNI